MAKKYVLRAKKAIYSFLKELKTDPDRRPYMGDRYQCPACGIGLLHFEPIEPDFFELLDRYQYAYTPWGWETLNFLQYTCPHCKINDRNRLYVMYFEKKFASLHNPLTLNVLEFAPSIGLRSYLKQFPFVNYRSADLCMNGVDDRVDITDMHMYADNSFDVFICSHVLEHVKNDVQAMRELYRILRPGGWGIAMVPIHMTVGEIQEDENVVSEEERWKHYGQGDHVRMYSRKGYVERLMSAGWKVSQFGIDHFGKEEFEKYGIHRHSVLYVMEKR